jgi:hypothetical protein
MRAGAVGAIVLVSLFVVACSPSAPPAQHAVETKPAEPEKATLPSDVPIPIGLEGRRDSTQPGSAFFVVQGQIPSSVPDAAAAFRKQAEDNGWKAVGEPAPAPNGSVETLVFEKDTRSLKITLVKAQNTITSMNLLTGPK